MNLNETIEAAIVAFSEVSKAEFALKCAIQHVLFLERDLLEKRIAEKAAAENAEAAIVAAYNS
jgi:hypothetical protein